MEINETLLRQIIEEVLSEMKSGADKAGLDRWKATA
jgi:propanediol dehydratase medium subunit